MEQALFTFAVTALLAGVLCYFAFRRDRAVFEHSIVLDAPRDRVFSVVNNLRSWSEWLPRATVVMPSIFPSGPVFTFEGLGSGRGAVMFFRHPKDGWVDRWEIIEATEPAAVVVSQKFCLPHRSTVSGRVEVRIRPFTELPFRSSSTAPSSTG